LLSIRSPDWGGGRRRTKHFDSINPVFQFSSRVSQFLKNLSNGLDPQQIGAWRRGKIDDIVCSTIFTKQLNETPPSLNVGKKSVRMDMFQLPPLYSKGSRRLPPGPAPARRSGGGGGPQGPGRRRLPRPLALPPGAPSAPPATSELSLSAVLGCVLVGFDFFLLQDTTPQLLLCTQIFSDRFISDCSVDHRCGFQQRIFVGVHQKNRISFFLFSFPRLTQFIIWRTPSTYISRILTSGRCTPPPPAKRPLASSPPPIHGPLRPPRRPPPGVAPPPTAGPDGAGVGVGVCQCSVTPFRLDFVPMAPLSYCFPSTFHHLCRSCSQPSVDGDMNPATDASTGDRTGVALENAPGDSLGRGSIVVFHFPGRSSFGFENPCLPTSAARQRACLWPHKLSNS